jgi:bis(5'-nucleosyl)-tetraphosphatase (symmetrical)
MALFAIGDVQGCHRCLRRLLERMPFNPPADRLWFVGDLVNRGPDSLGVLRMVKDMDHAQVVLGNHDLHLLSVAVGARPLKVSDSFSDVLDADDRDELLAWLAALPLMSRDDDAGWIMVHAGLAPAWDVETATRLARQVEGELASHYQEQGFLRGMYGDLPARWHEGLNGMERTRFVINAMTRMRFCHPDGKIDLEHTGPPGSQPPALQPWFELWPHSSHRIVFGHWSALGAGDHGQAVSTDSGCVWGNRLTAVRLHPGPLEFFGVECRPPA